MRALSNFFKILLSYKKTNIQNLNYYLHKATQARQIDAKTATLIQGAMALRDMHVSDIMIPRSQIRTLKIDQSLDEILDVVTESGHSRFPVLAKESDQVLGLLLAKDLLKMTQKSFESTGLRPILRNAPFVPPSKRLNHLLNDFQHQRHHLALVSNEHGEIAGIITIEDIIEQVVGDIADEFDSQDDLMIFIHGDEKTYTVKGSTSVEDFNEALGSELCLEKYHTISGWVLEFFGYVPKKGDKCSYQKMQFEVLRADMKQIHLLKVTKNP